MLCFNSCVFLGDDLSREITLRLLVAAVYFKTLIVLLLLDFSLTVKAAPHECVIRTSQPQA